MYMHVAAVRLIKCVCVYLYACVVRVSGNDIGATGGTAVAEALEVNTGVLKIDLGSEWCWRCLPSVPMAAVRLTEYVCVSANGVDEETEKIIDGRTARNEHFQKSWAQRVSILHVMTHIGNGC